MNSIQATLPNPVFDSRLLDRPLPSRTRQVADIYAPGYVTRQLLKKAAVGLLFIALIVTYSQLAQPTLNSSTGTTSSAKPAISLEIGN